MPTYYPPGTRRNNRYYIVRGRIDRREREIRTTADNLSSANAHWRNFKVRLTGKRVNSPHSGPPRVYFIAVGDEAIKIGVAQNVEARMAALQTGNHEKLRLIGSIPGDVTTEKKFHRVFAKYHVHGEWFKAAPPLLQFIEFISEMENPKGPPPKTDLRSASRG
ncbi:MAG: GIY-YIG nuclease family protein [Gemmatimonadetes bacterium]|nr:GIY-YIG nuclease family protein [Gemmatimonadota bacterium]